MIICSHSNIDIIQGVIAYGDTEGGTDWRITNSNNGAFNILNNLSDNARVSILENGNFGIGITNPSNALDVNGDVNITGNYKKNNRDVINDTSNYVFATSNILVPRIVAVSGWGSNYSDRVGGWGSNYSDRIGGWGSNYTDLIGNYTSNYIGRLSIGSGGGSQWTTGLVNKIYYNTSNVGIGTTDPTNKLHIFDEINEPKLIIQNNKLPVQPAVTNSSIEFIRRATTDVHTDFKIGNYNGDFKIISSISGSDVDYFKITTSGGPSIYNPTGSPNWTTTSDKRIKENIEVASYDKCYENISKVDLYRFNYIKEFNNINKDINQLGFIAQYINEILPKAVSSYEFHNSNFNIPDLLSIDVTQINYSLYGAVKKLIEFNDYQTTRIKKLEQQIYINTNDTSNIAIDTSNIAIDTSNIAIDTSNIAIDTSNIS